VEASEMKPMNLQLGLKRYSQTICAILVALTLVACGESESPTGSAMSPSASLAGQSEAERWYTEAQANAGAQVFANNCALCHGDNAQGITEDWRAKLDDGNFPPPPLNGSAHAWHHPRSVLLQVVNNGGAAFGGQMPPFENVLNEEEKLQAIAFFQNLWTEEIYEQWEDINGSN